LWEGLLVALFSNSGLEATGVGLMYCPVCEARLMFDANTETYICKFCGWEVNEEDKPIPYALMVDF